MKKNRVRTVAVALTTNTGVAETFAFFPNLNQLEQATANLNSARKLAR